MSEKYIYRDVTEEDLDLLYSSKDAGWLIEHFESRNKSISPSRGNKAEVMVSADNNKKLFYFIEDFSKNEKGDWYIYYEQDKGLFIFQDRGSFHLLFYSQYFAENTKEIELKVLDLLRLASRDNKLGLYPTHEINEYLEEGFDFELGDTGRF